MTRQEYKQKHPVISPWDVRVAKIILICKTLKDETQIKDAIKVELEKTYASGQRRGYSEGVADGKQAMREAMENL